MALRFADDPLAWSYDNQAGVNRYRTPDGRFVGAETIKNLRNDFLDARAEQTRSLAADLASNVISLSEWEAQMREAIKTTFGVEYSFGKGGVAQMTPADWQHAGELVANQYTYLSGFADDIYAGDMTEEAIAARSDLYIGAATSAYEHGAARASGDPDLPNVPGDGSTQCLGNCRCNLVIEEVDGGWNVYWVTSDAPCPDCADRGDEWSPLELSSED